MFNRRIACFAAYVPSMVASQSFKNEAALHDPFAELGPIAQAAPQVSPPLKEVSPTQQQKYNLGAMLPRPCTEWIMPQHPFSWITSSQALLSLETIY